MCTQNGSGNRTIDGEQVGRPSRPTVTTLPNRTTKEPIGLPNLDRPDIIPCSTTTIVSEPYTN